MRQIKSQHELDQIHRSGSGFIYNDFSRKGASGKKLNVVHRADCRWIKKTKITVPKYFFDTFDEAFSWLGQNRGKEDAGWKQCGTCRPKEDPTAVRSPEVKSPTSKPVKPSGPFTESEVERLLIYWFKERGYEVKTQVAVPSGIIDIIVSGQKADWIIEVKGEDRGGFTSAQMNFQGGIGQLVSRMNDPLKRYALAFPFTEDYLSVLEKYEGTFGLEHLGIYLLAIGRAGVVKRFEGGQIDKLIVYMSKSHDC